MNTDPKPENLDTEPDADGVPRYQLMRDSSGKSWREPINYNVRGWIGDRGHTEGMDDT